MKPDGKGTDERVRQGSQARGSRWARPRSANSLERDIIMLAVAFAVLAVIGWSAVFLSKRAKEPSQATSDGANEPAFQQPP